MKKSYTPARNQHAFHHLISIIGKVGLSLSLLIAFVATSYAQTPTYYERVYADSTAFDATGLLVVGNVDNADNAVDGDVSTYSTINLTVGALGAGMWQSLIFSDPVPANTPVTIKLGIGTELLGLLNGITVYTGYNGQPVEVETLSNLLSLVGGAGVHEVTLVSSSTIDRINVKLTGAVSALKSLNVYDAYYMKQTTTPVCNAIPLDVIPGVSKAALDALGGVNGVDDPQNATDGDLSTYSKLQGLVGALNYTYEKVDFNGYSLPDDSVHVFLSSAGGLLNAGVLKTGWAIVTYKDGQIVDSLTSGTQLLSLNLLSGNSSIGEVSFKPSGQIDAVAVVLGGAVNALNELFVHEITIAPPTPQINSGSVSVNGDTLNVCTDSSFTLSVSNPQAGTTYNWYDSTGTQVNTGPSYDLSNLSKGIHVYKVTATRDACTTGSDSAKVVVNVNDPDQPVLDPATDTTICSGDTVVLQASAPQDGATFNWYTSETGGTPIRVGQDTIHVIPDATTTYYAETVLGSCTSATRTGVTVNVNTTPQPPVIDGPTGPICTGETATLTVPAQSGVTYNWYTDTTATAVATGNSYTTSALTDTTVFYVEAVGGGGCIAAGSFAADTVNVSPEAPTPVLVTDTIYASAGQAVTFEVIDSAGINYNWYDAATGGTSIASGTEFTKSFTTAGTHYVYVEASSASGGCVSAVRDTAVAIISNPSGAPCNYANAQQSPVHTGGIISVCLLCDVIDPNNAIDGDLSTASNIRINVGVSTYIGQMVEFQHQGKAGDSIRLVLSLPGGLADADLLSGVRIETYNNGTASGNPVFLNGSLLRLTLLSGDKFEAVLPATTDYDAVLVSFGGNLNISALTSLGLYNAEQLIPLPTIAPGKDTVEVCAGSAATLSVTAASGTSVKWYDAPSGGTLLSSDATYTTDPVTDTTIYYVTAVRDGCENPNRLPVVVAPSAAPEAPALVADTVAICAGDSALLEIDNPQTGMKYYWYAAETGGTPLDSGVAFTTPVLSSDQVYYVETQSGNCTTASTRTEAVVVLNPSATAGDITVTGNDPLCLGDTAVLQATASGIAAPVFTWYADAALTDSIGTGAALSVHPSHDTTYYVTVQGTSACENIPGDAKVVSVTVTDQPQPPVVTGPSPATICAGQSATLQIQSPETGVTYNWYTDTTSTSPVFTGNTYTTDALTDTTTFYVSAANASGCVAAGVFTSFTVNVNAEVPVPTLVADTLYATVGDGLIFHVKDSSGITYTWYDQATGGSAVATGNSFTTPVFTSAGTHIYYVEAGNGSGCTSPARAKAVAIINDSTNVNCYMPNKQQTLYSLLCLACTVEQPLNAIDGDTTTHSDVRGNIGLLANVAQYFQFQHLGKAGDTLKLMLGSSTGLLDLGALDGVRIWFTNGADTAYGPVQLTKDLLELELLNSTANKTTVKIIAPMDYDGVALGIGGLAVALKSLYIYQVEQHFALPALDADSVTACPDESITLSATANDNGDDIVWYDEAGNQVGVGSTFTVDTLTQSTTYYVTSRRGDCVSPDRLPVVVTIHPGAKAGDIKVTGPKGPICAGDTTTLTAVLSATATGIANPVFIWYGDANLTDSLFTGTSFDVHPTRDTTYYVTVQDINSGICENAPGDAAQVTIEVNQLPDPNADLSVVGDSTLCDGTSTDLVASTSIPNPIFTWYSDSMLTQIVSNKATYTVTPDTTTTYYLTVAGDGYCQSAAKAVTVYVSTASGPGDIDVDGADQGYCAGDSIHLEVSSHTVANAVFEWYSDENLTHLIHSGTRLDTVATGPVTFYVSVTGDGVCSTGPKSGSKEVDITINPDADPADIQVSGDTVICVGDTTTLVASDNKVTDPVFTWYSDAQLTQPLDTAAQLQVHPVATTTYYLTVHGTNACENVSNVKEVTVTVNDAPMTPVITGPVPDTICYGKTATLEIQSPENNVTYIWYTDTTGMPLDSGATYTTDVLTDSTTFYVRAVNGSGCAAAGAAASFRVNVNAEVPVPQLVNDTVYASVGDSVVFQVQDSTGIIYTWYDQATGGNTVATGTSFTTPVFTSAGTYTYYVEASNADGCTSPSRAKAVAIISGPSGADCYVANQQYSPMYSIGCLICTVNDPENAVDGDTTTHSEVIASVGLLGNVAQYLEFQHSGLTGDTIHLTLGSSTGLLDAGALAAGIRIWYYKDGQKVQGPVELTSALLNLKLLSGDTKANLDVVAPVDYDGVAIGLGGGVTALTKLYIYQAEQHIVMPTVAPDADTITICSGETATLSATSNAADNQVVWYDGDGNQKHIGETYTTDALTMDTVFYVSAIRDGCANPNRIPVVVMVNPGATATDIQVSGSGNEICEGETTMLEASSQTITNPVFHWYSDSALTDTLYTGNKFEVHPDTTTTYYVTVLGDGVCENAPDSAKQVTVTVNLHSDSTDVDIAGGGQGNAICEGDSTVLTASSKTVTNPVFVWYGNKALTDSLYTGASYTVHPDTTTTYYVSVSGDGVCATEAGDAAHVTVYVNPHSDSTDVDIAGGGKNNAICEGDTTLLTASSKTVTNPVFVWYGNKALTDSLYTGAAYAVHPDTTTTYYVSVSGDGVCTTGAGDAAHVTVYVNPHSDSTDVDIAGGGKNNAICEGDTTVLTASSTTVTNPVFTWYSDKSLQTQVHTGATYQVHPSQTTTYYVSVSGDGICATEAGDAAHVTVYVNPTPDSTDIDIDGGGKGNELCEGESTVLKASSTTVTNPVFNWYSDASLNTKVHTGASFTVSPAQTTSYYVTVMGTGFCETPAKAAKKVTVYVSHSTDSTDIHIDGNGGPICAGDSRTLTASSTTVTNPVFTWYSDKDLQTQVHTGATFKVSPTQTTTYYVTVMGTGFCETPAKAAKKVTVVVNETPQDPKVNGPADAVCSGTAATLTIDNPQTGVTYDWYSDASLNTNVHTGTSYTTDKLTATTTFYVVATSQGGCSNASGSTEVTVKVAPLPEPPKVKATDVAVCLGSKAEFEIDNPQSGYTYNWYTTKTGGTPASSGTSFTTAALQADAVYYVEAATSGGCVNAQRIMVTATVVSAPVKPTIDGPTGPICPGETATLEATSTTPGVTYHWYSQATGGTELSADASFITPELDQTTTYYVEAEVTGGCVNAGGRTSITVEVYAELPAPQVQVKETTASSVTFEWAPVSGATGYQVSIDNGTTWEDPSSGATGTTHTVTGLKPGEAATITVKALGASACQNSAPSIAVTGKAKNPLGNNFFVPNAFSPNGDGTNDVWKVYGNTIKELHMAVYNQYGQKIFESKNIDGNWDGTYKGKMQPVGVYVYYVEVTFQDGKKATKKGSITLIR